MYRTRAFIKHFLTATNHHGVHSPFVYTYVTECLYAQSTLQDPKSISVLLKTIRFFGIKTMTLVPWLTTLETRIKKEFDLRFSRAERYDLIYFDDPSKLALNDYLPKIHNNSVLFIDNIHRTAEHSGSWKYISQNSEVTVSIDLFYCGLIFFRREQVKEHFKIRI